VKFKLTNISMQFAGRTLYRIRALKDFGYGFISAGDLGGWVEFEHNLSHDGNCWIFNDAKVMDHGSVLDDAILRDQSCVFNRACVCNDALLLDYAVAHEDAWIGNYAVMKSHARASGSAELCDFAVVDDGVLVTDSAKVCGSTRLSGYIVVSGNTQIGIPGNGHVIQSDVIKVNL